MNCERSKVPKIYKIAVTKRTKLMGILKKSDTLKEIRNAERKSKPAQANAANLQRIPVKSAE